VVIVILNNKEIDMLNICGKKLLALVILTIAMSTPALSQNETTSTPSVNETSTSPVVEYVLELGDGDSVIVFGDGNTIYLPMSEEEKEDPPIPTNIGEYKEDLSGWILDIQSMTDLAAFGVKSSWSRLIIYLGDNGTWTVVWGEQ
jgi:hypothetical protein